MEITLSQGEVMPSACTSQMFLLHIHLLLPEAFTTSCFEPEHRTTIRCFSSPWTEAVLITQGDRVPPAPWGWDFFLNTAREGLPWQGVWRGLGSAVQVVQNCSFAMGLHKAGSAAGEASPASLHGKIPLPATARQVCVGRVGSHPAGCQGHSPPCSGFTRAQPRHTNTCAGPAGACLFSCCKESLARAASPLSLLLGSPGAVTALSHCSWCSLSRPGEAGRAQGCSGGV